MLGNNDICAPEDKSKTIRLCDKLIHWSLLTLAALTPIFFLPWTIDPLEINKQLLLVMVAAISGVAWFGKMLVAKRFEYRRSIINVMVVLFALVYSLSAWRSDYAYQSMLGDSGQQMASLVSILSLVTLYFVIVNNVRTTDKIRRLIMSVLIGGSLAAIYAVLQGLGLFIEPFEFTKSATFNSVGTMTAVGIFMSFLVTLAGSLLLMGHGLQKEQRRQLKVQNILAIIAGVFGLFMVIIIDLMVVNIALFVGSAALIAFAFVHANNMKGLSGIIMPVFALIMSVMLLVFSFPIHLGYPAEVAPSLSASYKIASQTLRERPFLGSGPATFIYDFAKYRAPEMNLSQFWNIRFDRASSYFMTAIATNGLLGTLSWLLMVLTVVYVVTRRLICATEENWHTLIGAFAAWLPLLVARFFYSTNMTLEIVFWITLALLVASGSSKTLTFTFDESPRAAMGVSFVFILGIVFAAAAGFVATTHYASEVAYAQAVQIDSAGGDINDVVGKMRTAVTLNNWNSSHARNLSQALLAKSKKDLETPVELAKNEGESDEDYNKRLETAKQDAVRASLTLTGDAVNVAKQAAEMNPKNVTNWDVLGALYESVIGLMDGADTWALDAYQKTIDLEPANPINHTKLGKIYFYQANTITAQAEKAEGETKEGLTTKGKDLLGKAKDSFNKAIELKADYAPARYNLALVLDAEGLLKDAIVKMEEVVSLNNKDTGVGFQLALMYFRDERKDEARRLMESVIAIEPNFANAYWYLGAMYEENNEFDKAIAAVKKVKELNPDNDQVSKRLSELNAKKNGPAPADGGTGELPGPVETDSQNANQPTVGQ